MSSKSSRGPAKKFEVKTQEPREIDAIQADYGQAASKAGEVQYQIFILESELKQLNEQMLDFNREGAARNKLNKAKTPVEASESK